MKSTTYKTIKDYVEMIKVDYPNLSDFEALQIACSVYALDFEKVKSV